MSIADFRPQNTRRLRQPRQVNPHLVIDRPRVVHLIETGSSAPLCIVRAPRMVGKTIALQQWAQETSRDTAWLVLEYGQPNDEVFWQQLLQVVEAKLGRDAGASHGIEHRGQAAAVPANDPVSTVAAALAGAEPFTVIIENFHFVTNAALERDLARLLTLAPELSFIVTARSALDIERTQLSVGLDVYIVDTEDLIFTAAEAAQFHANTALADISTELNDYFQGNPVAHRTARMVAGDPMPPAGSFADHVKARVGDLVLLESVANREQFQTPELARILALTLPLNHFDAALVRALAPELDNQLEQCISKLLENNILISANTSHGVSYSYRPVLKTAITRMMTPEIAACKAQTLETAATFELARQEFSPAFEYAIANKAYRQASDILIQSGLRLFADSGRVLHRTLPRIPKTQLAKYPLLTVALGVVYNGDNRTRFKGLEHFALALTSTPLLGKSVPSVERLAIGLARALALRLTGQFKLAASSARTSLKNLHELPLEDRDKLHIFESLALSQWGLTLLLSGDHSTAEKALQRAAAAGARMGSSQAQYFPLSLLAYRYALDGDLRTAATYADLAAGTFVESPSMDLYQQTPLAMARAMIELGRLRPEAAANYLAPVLSETATSEFWGRLRIIEARIDLLRGHAGIATGRLTVALARRKDLPALNPGDSIVLAVLETDLLLSAGNASAARTALNKLPVKNPASIIAKARLSLATGAYVEVVELLGAPIQFATIMQQLEAQILVTIARLHLQNMESVRADLEMISGALATLENHLPLVMLTAPDRELLRTSMQGLGVPFLDVPTMPAGGMPTTLTSITLTPRESTILATLAVTGDRAEIARLNFVTLNTVKSQLRSLYKKLGVTSRDDALLVAHQENLLD